MLGRFSRRTITTVALPFDVHRSMGGSHAPMIILHGFFGCRANNRTVGKQLARRLDRDVYCLDLRNHGSAPHAPEHNYVTMAADVARFIEDHRLDRPIVCGHSMGAKTAMGVALTRPELLLMLISVDNAPVAQSTGRPSEFNGYIRALREITERKLPPVKNHKEADAILARVELRLPVRQFLLTNIKKNPGEGLPLVSRVPLDYVGRYVDRDIMGWPFEGKHWGGPTLFVRGTQSNYVADEYLQACGETFPQFEVKDIDAGHWVISEKPNEFVEAVVEWVERKED